MRYSKEDVKKAHQLMDMVIEKYKISDIDAALFGLALTVRVFYEWQQHEGNFYKLLKNDVDQDYKTVFAPVHRHN